MLILAMLASAQAADIVITGKRLADEQALCVHGGCPPLRDIQSSVALAESQFLAGSYLPAKQTLSSAAQRNRRFAARYPKPVAALFDAYATVALHDGDQEAYRRALAEELAILRDNLPAGDPATLGARGRIGGLWIKTADFSAAAATFRTIEREATASGQPEAAMIAAMKSAWLVGALGERDRALKMVDALEQRPLGRTPAFRRALNVLRLRISARGADDERIAQLASVVSRDQGDPPMLLYGPPLDTHGLRNPRDAFSPESGTVRRGIDTAMSANVEWIDVGFWIRPDGRTDGAEILRGSLSHSWAGAILTQIAGRRYTPVADRPDHATTDPGTYRLERVTRSTAYGTPTGSLVRRRMDDQGYEILDLTADVSARDGKPAKR